MVASTSAPARLLKLDDMGTVAAGKSADFIVLDANPLDDIANVSRIAAMHLRGQTVDRTALAARWTGRAPAAAAGSAPTAAAVPLFKVDPYWPKPFPATKDARGNLHRWATGEIGGTCIDSHDHIFTLNRGWQQSSLGKLHTFEAMSSLPAPQVVAVRPRRERGPELGRCVAPRPAGGTKVMPRELHGCFVDSEDTCGSVATLTGSCRRQP